MKWEGTVQRDSLADFNTVPHKSPYTMGKSHRMEHGEGALITAQPGVGTDSVLSRGGCFIFGLTAQ